VRVRRLRVAGFGNLKGDFIFSSDRCNLILEPNESGKSTLAASILAALYGFPRERATRDRPVKLKEQYRPWSGGPFAVELELECRQRAFIVRRDFDQETVTVHDGHTGGEITQEFSRGKDHLDFGEMLTGLSREEFIRTCFVGQREIDMLGDAASLTNALQRTASSQHGDVVAGEAIEALTHATERDYEGMRLGRGKVDTEIKRLDREIDEVRAEMESIASRRRASEQQIRNLEAATAREGQVEENLARVDFLCLMAARSEVDAALKQATLDREEIEGYRAEIRGLEPLAAFPTERLGELRELKGKVDAMEERRGALERRLLDEFETPLEHAEAASAAMASFDALDDKDAALASDRLAVLNDLWRVRREKRRALRHEERRLIAEGIAPDRVKELAARLSVLNEADRAFLTSYRERLLEVKAVLSEAERDRERLLHAEGGEAPTLITLAAARHAEAFSLGASFLGVVLSVVLFILKIYIPLVVTGLLAAAGFIYWLRLLEKRPVPGAEEFGSDLQRVQTDIWMREKEHASLQERILGIASRVGRTTPDRLLEEFRELEGLQEKAAPLAALAASVNEAKERYRLSAEELLDIMNRAGRLPGSRLVTPRVARLFRDDLARCLEARRVIAALRAAMDSAVKELGDLVVEIDRTRETIAKLLMEALGPEGAAGDLETALAQFEGTAARKERLDRLRLEVLPAAERRSAEAPGVLEARLRRERDVLTRQIDKAAAAQPSLAGLEPGKKSREYVEERRQLQEEARRTQKERQVLSEELGDVLKEYRRDYPGRQTLLSSLESARARAEAFRDAVAIAKDVLSTISREAYAEWADVLNDKAGEILRRLAPGYEEVRFDTDLSFSLREMRTGRRLDQPEVDAHLSTGARDQIYLAVRMATVEYLSTAGVRLPLILDDPFTSFDDERFARAMDFMVDIAGRRHQILILSCHAARHRAWQASNADSLGDAVRVLDLTPLST